ncbi:HAD-superfamily hydrolase, subfamily IA, variant 3 [Geobacter metallireducens RCH3]|uniref:Phosphatase/phosphohexomutase-related hydrolase n=1 Tax=Geobacter metallireducens (strain ATCC 53774 / DSM 7210 / GS-15) TaxID=269799 RepID=Q39VZ2_GEOMG|nr:HAD family phosphatase [Geobacter metallireducens]ABB31582.1 phosphatase/phosphohexomutase-related hydrolase [Geobacter metallireducens GS-15]EHP86657.1 HAD-superfamily hydrolase, subfamily IA, variant 3 [Geobacter metallireducens RCH3]
MLSAVIFDFDGIIVDTEPLHYRAFQAILEPLGLGYAWEEYVNLYMGFDDRDAFREAFRVHGRTLNDHELELLIDRKAAAFQEIISSGVAPYPGVVELIRSINGTFPLALCSGALRCDILPILAGLGLSNAFDVMVTAEEVTASKPDPASYALAVERLAAAFVDRGILPGRCIAIEDTPAGIASATGAGIPVIAVTNSYPAEMLSGAVRVVDSLAGLALADIENLAR